MDDRAKRDIAEMFERPGTLAAIEAVKVDLKRDAVSSSKTKKQRKEALRGLWTFEALVVKLQTNRNPETGEN